MTATTRAEREAAQSIRYWPTAKAYAVLDRLRAAEKQRKEQQR